MSTCYYYLLVLEGLWQPTFKLQRDFLLMPTNDASVNPGPQEQDWVVSCNKRYRANVIFWGMHKSLLTFEIWAKLADRGLVWGVLRVSVITSC